MIYPNGTIELRKLVKMVNSKDFMVYYEEKTEEPSGWDWRKDGIFHGNRVPIHNKEELIYYIDKELNEKGTICYDITEEYFKKHPYEGESITYIEPRFFWEWQSYNTKKCYSITESSYLGKKPKNVPLCLNMFDGNFEGTCFVIGTWERDSEGYEFRSVGSRMFGYVADEDLSEIWKAIKNADKYLNDRFHNEEED
jgi:hypothetical protein